MSTRRFAVNLCLLSCTAFVLMTPLSGYEKSLPEPRLATASRSIVATTTPELLAALAAGPDLTIFVKRGTYLLDHAIQVPDGTALIGEGEMLFDADGLPTSFVPESRTVIAAIAGVTGDFVTLNHGASLQGLVIQDIVRPALTGGSVVVVSSRNPSDSVSAQVGECEIINANPVTGPGLNGPVGRGLMAITRNRSGAGGAAPHEQSLVSVHLTQSIIRSPGGGDAIFAINNASGSHIELHLRENVVGKLGANGGISRPDSTVGASVLIQSIRNLYRPDTNALNLLGWQLQGGGDAPMLAPLIAEATLNNKLSVHSVNDRIEGFARGMTATGAQRMSALAGPITSNEMELILEGTCLESSTFDFQLFGARNLPGTADGNELRVTMRHVTGSGSRANTYGDAASNLGVGNRLIVSGNPNAFSQTNDAILPMPGEQFFTGGRPLPFARWKGGR
jgi:hypothetical protein